MEDQEIVINLWYVQDPDGFIYSLRARAYIGTGSDEDKLALLQRFALSDYLIATPFQVPERFHIQLPSTGQKLAVSHRSVVDHLDSRIAMFEDAIRALNSALPGQTPLNIGPSPIVCITTLVGGDGEPLGPVVTGVQRVGGAG